MINQKLLLAAMVGSLTSARFISTQPSRGTAGNPRRFKHLSEVEQEKLAAKRRDIAEWNARLEKQT